MSIFMFAASLRKDSFNKKLISLVAQLIGTQKYAVDLADFADFDLPLYHGDLNAEKGIPANAKKFISRMHAAKATIISSPEYNFSSPGTLKNLIDWVSRETPMPWRGQHILLISASPSMVGGNRGLWHTRVPLESCGAFVYPDMFSLATAHESFDTDGNLKDKNLQQRLQQLLESFLHYID